MGVDLTEEREQRDAPATESKRKPAVEAPAIAAPPRRSPRDMLDQAVRYVREGLPQLRWGLVILLALAAGILMPLSVSQSGPLSLFAGIVPVGAGLIIGRRVQAFYGLHGFVTGLIAAVLSLAIINVLIFYTPIGAGLQQAAVAAAGANSGIAVPTLEAVSLQLSSFVPFSLITFCTFGAVMSGRTEERNRLVREEVASRGGRLEKPGVIRTLDDLRGLSLPQFGSYVNTAFKKQGFTFKDYRFVDKDKHLDLWMEHEQELWHLRLTVQDKINPGTVEGLVQEMRREKTAKGAVVTSTEFTPSAQKSAKGRAIVLVDGPTLFQITQ